MDFILNFVLKHLLVSIPWARVKDAGSHALDYLLIGSLQGSLLFLENCVRSYLSLGRGFFILILNTRFVLEEYVCKVCCKGSESFNVIIGV